MNENRNDIEIQKNQVENNIISYNKPNFIVQDDGIYIPVDHFSQRMILSKEAFIEAYRKYIKGE